MDSHSAPSFWLTITWIFLFCGILFGGCNCRCQSFCFLLCAVPSFKNILVTRTVALVRRPETFPATLVVWTQLFHFFAVPTVTMFAVIIFKSILMARTVAIRWVAIRWTLTMTAPAHCDIIIFAGDTWKDSAKYEVWNWSELWGT